MCSASIGEGLPHSPESAKQLILHRAQPFSSRWEPVADTELERLCFELGWDYYVNGVKLRASREHNHPALMSGYRAARTHFGFKYFPPGDIFTCKWVRLRLSALSRRKVLDHSVTPELLRNIAVRYCPVTREELHYPKSEEGQLSPEVMNRVWTIDRLENMGGYIEGNIIVMSYRANLAKSNLGFRDARNLATWAEKEKDGILGGLSAAEWARVAALCGPVQEDLSLYEVGCFPRLALVPGGVLISNLGAVVQQDFMCLVNTVSSYKDMSHRLGSWISRFSGKKTQQLAVHFIEFFIGSYHQQVNRLRKSASDWNAIRQWALEDAWLSKAVMSAWNKLFLSLDSKQMERLTSFISKKSVLATLEVDDWRRRAGFENRGFMSHPELLTSDSAVLT